MTSHLGYLGDMGRYRATRGEGEKGEMRGSETIGVTSRKHNRAVRPERTWTRNIAALGVAAAVSRLGYFISLSIIARAVGVSDFGRFSFALTVFVAFSIVANFGLENLVVRTLARASTPIVPFLATAARLRLFAIPLAVVIGAGLIARDAGSLWLVVLLGAYGLGNAIVLFDVALFRGADRMELQTLVLAGQAVLSIGFVVGALAISPTAEAGAAAYVIATVLTVGVSRYLRRRLDLLGAQAVAGPVGPLFSANLPFALMLLGLLVFDRSALVLLGMFDSDEAVGWFGAAYLVLIAAANLPNVVINAVFPTLSRAAEAPDRSAFRTATSRLVAVIALVGLVVAVSVYFVAHRFITFAFGRFLFGRWRQFALVNLFVNFHNGNIIFRRDTSILHDLFRHEHWGINTHRECKGVGWSAVNFARFAVHVEHKSSIKDIVF